MGDSTVRVRWRVIDRQGDTVADLHSENDAHDYTQRWNKAYGETKFSVLGKVEIPK